jgi:ABC-type metal ion transport system substrate-binding protein
MDKESLELVNNAYKEAKKLLKENYIKLVEFSELLVNNTIVMNKDIDVDKMF